MRNYRSSQGLFQKEKLKTVAERKEFLYSLIHDKHIQGSLTKETHFKS